MYFQKNLISGKSLKCNRYSASTNIYTSQFISQQKTVLNLRFFFFQVSKTLQNKAIKHIVGFEWNGHTIYIYISYIYIYISCIYIYDACTRVARLPKYLLLTLNCLACQIRYRGLKLNFKLWRDNEKKFLWAPRLWVGRLCESILSSISKMNGKQNSGS